MSVLYETIKNIDDDYLIGLSNKGTVKRAYKDLEGMNVEPVMSEDRILFDFDGTQCEIKMPLSESTCRTDTGKKDGRNSAGEYSGKRYTVGRRNSRCRIGTIK